MDKKFRITFLGTSAASISPRAATSAYLVELGETRILVDSGIGALRQLRKAGLTADDIDSVLITHWHFDHFAGLPAIVRSRSGSRPLQVFGPKPPYYIRALLRSVFPAVMKHFTETGEHHSLPFDDLTAESFPMSHKLPTLGWILSENSPGGRRVAISGDTRPEETIIQSASGVDLLVYEATYLNKHVDRAVRNKHSTVSEAAILAAKSKVKRLALTHVSSRYAHGAIRAECEGIFPGALLPQPLTCLSIETTL